MTRRRVRKRRSSSRIGAGLIKVHRRGYYRRAYDYVRDGKRIHVRGHYVRATDYYIRDRGKPGKGPKLIKVTPGKMTEWAVKLGYIREGQHIDDIPLRKIDDFALDLAKAVGPARAWRMFHAQVIFRKNARENLSPGSSSSRVMLGLRPTISIEGLSRSTVRFREKAGAVPEFEISIQAAAYSPSRSSVFSELREISTLGDPALTTLTRPEHSDERSWPHTSL